MSITIIQVIEEITWLRSINTEYVNRFLHTLWEPCEPYDERSFRLGIQNAGFPDTFPGTLVKIPKIVKRRRLIIKFVRSIP